MSTLQPQQQPQQKPTPKVAVIIGLVFMLAMIVWKIFLFRHAARTSNGWAVFFSMLTTPFDAITFMFKKKCLVAV